METEFPLSIIKECRDFATTSEGILEKVGDRASSAPPAVMWELFDSTGITLDHLRRLLQTTSWGFDPSDLIGARENPVSPENAWFFKLGEKEVDEKIAGVGSDGVVMLLNTLYKIMARRKDLLGQRASTETDYVNYLLKQPNAHQIMNSALEILSRKRPRFFSKEIAGNIFELGLRRLSSYIKDAGGNTIAWCPSENAYLKNVQTPPQLQQTIHQPPQQQPVQSEHHEDDDNRQHNMTTRGFTNQIAEIAKALKNKNVTRKCLRKRLPLKGHLFRTDRPRLSLVQNKSACTVTNSALQTNKMAQIALSLLCKRRNGY